MINRKNYHPQRPSLLLLFVLLSVTSGAGVRAQQGQQQQREGRAVNPGVPSATPTPIRTVPAPATAASAPKSVEELRARVAAVLNQPQLASALSAVRIVSLDTGRTVFEENANKFVMPASNMKIYTVAAALARLTPDYRFTTSVYAAARPDAAGAVRGNLIVYGRGDPTFAARFNDGDYFRAVDDLAGRIAAAGVRRVEGDLVGDESYFTGAPLGVGWEWDDLQWYYGAEVSALSVNDNAIEITVKAAARAGDPCAVTTDPETSRLVSVLWNKQSGNNEYWMFPYPTTSNARPTGTTTTGIMSQASANAPYEPLITIVNDTTTAAPSAQRDFRVFRPLSTNVIFLSGSLPQGGSFTGSIAVAHPAQMFIASLRNALTRRGVTVTGKPRTVDARSRGGLPPLTSLVEITNRQSPPLSVIAAQTLKPSQNLYTELILRALGQNIYPNGTGTSAEAGIKVVADFLREAGVDSTKVVQADGSGLSRSNLVTAGATTQLLTYMSKHRFANIFRDAMPVAGVDGTLRTRMKGTAAAGNVRAKTGTLTGVTSLSGYVTSASGERFVFALLVNNYPREWDARTNYTDQIAVLLASFAGRS